MAQPAIDLGLGGPGEPLGSPGPLALALEVCEVTHRFGPHTALDGVSLGVPAGEVHAILGPNGAGKTTLLRVLSGLTEPAGGEVWFHVGGDLLPGGWQARRLIGVVGSAERSFYLRLSGLENLIFFGRLHGLRRRAAKTRAHQLLERVGLCAAAGQRVGTYSQGMKQRLAVARAFLSAPPVLLFDEATHDLDPEGAATVRGLAAEAAAGGAAVLWATQRLEEIRGFAQAVTLLHDGRVRFGGTVEQLIARSAGRSYVVRLRDGGREATHLDGVLGEHGRLSPIAGDTEHYRLRLDSEDALGRALARLVANSVDVLACREESSEIEQAFLRLVGAGR